MRTRLPFVLAALFTAGMMAQSPSDDPGNFIKIDDPVIALTNARVIDGTGAPARENQTVLIRDGNIASVGNSADVSPPAGAMTIDLTGKSVMPGLVMLHEHLFYPTGPSVYGQLAESFVRLYLAGGVTTMRTAGNMHGVMDVKIARAIEQGSVAGPTIDATAPYLDGPNSDLQLHTLDDAADARQQVAYWAGMGATSYKAYMNITRAELAAVIAEAHRRSLKVTAHLCSVTYAEAADMGIDDLEHGFAPATDFVDNKRPDFCPGQKFGQEAVVALSETGAPFTGLVKKLIDRHVALTSTLTVYETFTPGRPVPPGLDVLVPELKRRFEQMYRATAEDRSSVYTKLFPKEMALERAFVRAGGMLLAGTDPTGYGGVIPGFANARELELLVEAGFTPSEAIQIGTLNGARYLNRDRQIGSITAGKQADLIVVNGDPSKNIADVRNVDTVFKQGVGFDPARLIDSVRGHVGLW
jgi:enamidase